MHSPQQVFKIFLARRGDPGFRNPNQIRRREGDSSPRDSSALFCWLADILALLLAKTIHESETLQFSVQWQAGRAEPKNFRYTTLQSSRSAGK
jgi:hypothetical protein